MKFVNRIINELDLSYNAYIFNGGRGYGQVEVFKYLVKMKLGHKGNCHCKKCIMVENLSLPSIFHLSEYRVKKGDVDSIMNSQIQDKFIFIESQVLSVAIQNSLLKSLEENEYLIVISINNGFLLDTVLSRCFKVDFCFRSKYDFDEYVMRNTKFNDFLVERYLQEVSLLIDDEYKMKYKYLKALNQDNTTAIKSLGLFTEKKDNPDSILYLSDHSFKELMIALQKLVKDIECYKWEKSYLVPKERYEFNTTEVLDLIEKTRKDRDDLIHLIISRKEVSYER